MSGFRNAATFLAALWCASIYAEAQEQESRGGWTKERVLKGIEVANGGLSAIENVRDLRVMGEIEVDGATADFILMKRRPDRTRIGIYFSGSSEETAHDGKQTWKRLENRQLSVAWLLSEEERKIDNLDLDFDGPMIGEPLPGVEIEFLGVERIDRVEYLKMEVLDQRARSVHFIDSRTFREFKKEVYSLEDPDQLMLTTYSSEYRNYNPIWVAHLVRQVAPDGAERILRLRQVEFNIGILERAFAPPSDVLDRRPTEN